MSQALQRAARAIFHAALQAVDVWAAVHREISLEDGVLTLAQRSVPLTDVDEVVIIAVGKAAVPMFLAAEDALAGTPCRAVVVGPAETLPFAHTASRQVAFLPGAHPTPTADSLRAGQAILGALASVSARSVVLFLVSGGASAMVEQPLNPAILLDDLAAFSRALVGSGLDIAAMNTLRKHLSAVKGGRLASAAAAARMQCTLLISDVPSALPDAIGSGPSLPDSTTVADTRELFAMLQNVSMPLPATVNNWFSKTLLPETPKADDPAFQRAHWKVVLSSEHLALAAMEAATAAGFYAMVDNTCDEWEYRAAGRYLLDRSLALASEAAGPTCLISVGEVSVALTADAGEGGRNQQFALWCASELARRGQAATVLSAGSDGIDGHSCAAGAVCDEKTAAQATNVGLSVAEALDGFDTSPLLRKIAATVETGPTGNNLRDLRLILSGSNSAQRFAQLERPASSAGLSSYWC